MAWYPEDALDLDTLKKYADFAMYEVKHSTKGEVREFDMERYRAGVYEMEQRSDFEKLIRERRVDYCFQPIISAHDGHVAAYEALMRPQLPTLRSPADKQQFLKTLIDYAHPRGVQVLAEGVETLSELRKVLEMGVDLLQGYCLARPAAEPGAIDEKAAEVIAEVERQRAEREEAWS